MNILVGIALLIPVIILVIFSILDTRNPHNDHESWEPYEPYAPLYIATCDYITDTAFEDIIKRRAREEGKSLTPDCKGCGAPMDLLKSLTCEYCGRRWGE